MNLSARRRLWQSNEASELAERRAAPAEDLATRLERATQWLAVTVAEIARHATSPEDLRRRLQGDAPASSPSAIWRKRKATP